MHISSQNRARGSVATLSQDAEAGSHHFASTPVTLSPIMPSAPKQPPVPTVRVVVISFPARVPIVRRIRDCLVVKDAAFSPQLVHLCETIDDGRMPIIDDTAALHEDQAAFAAKANWPVLMKLLVKDSATITVGGCPVIFRTSSTGVAADYVCRFEGSASINARIESA